MRICKKCQSSFLTCQCDEKLDLLLVDIGLIVGYIFCILMLLFIIYFVLKYIWT